MNQNVCARIKLSENTVIPPNCEKLVKGYIQGDCLITHGLIEPEMKVQKRAYL